MLNISNNGIGHRISKTDLSTLNKVESRISSKVLRRLLYLFSSGIFILLFVPWTQNIRSGGYVTTLKPDQRPQTINSIIAGRVEEWYVQEGDLVKKGDMILNISEVKDEYFDP